MYLDWVNAKILQKAVICDQDNNILVIKRSSTKEGNRPGKWDFPGGNVDAGDLAITEVRNIHILSIKREIKEETGFEIGDLWPIYMQSNVSTRGIGNIFVLVMSYKAFVDGIKPNVNLSLEHEEYKWIRKEEIYDLDFGSVREFFIKSIESL